MAKNVWLVSSRTAVDGDLIRC